MLPTETRILKLVNQQPGTQHVSRGGRQETSSSLGDGMKTPAQLKV